ncbi:hypothetical protein IWW36_005330 [Coemansia brasiliensis]|uniref:Carboxymuconolactone decarboxylase-like domain-containing protein n=1 Tax=Coemansia brasiliensis TaxID=2650707 RepID=A0A9W8LWR5_9FUNG|nr:hypothetical protein IWW36_005330 [Coemansia brasiliensis]
MDSIRKSKFARINAAGAALNPPLRYAIAVTAMAAANLPDLVTDLTKACESSLSNTQMKQFIELTRESLLKMVSTIGAPRVINSIAALMDNVDESIKAQLPICSHRRREEYDYDFIRGRGRELWQSVYSKQADKLEQKIGSWYPDLIEIIQTDLYGRLLADCRILDAKSTELCTIGALLPTNVPAQLKSHIIGAGRLGASPEEIAAATAIAELVST